MEDFKNPNINEITCMCSAQSAKTETIMALVAWVIDQDPGPILWVTTNMQEARKFARARLMPLLEKCGPIIDKMPAGRYDKTTTAIYFPGAPLFIVGADSPAALQSTPFRYIFLDEVRSWKEGALEMVSKRVRSFPHSYKKVVVSTPAKQGDHLHRAFMAGTQNEWHVKCPECGNEHALEWGDEKTPGGVKWDRTEVTKVNGEYDYEELLKTIRYECWNCDYSWRDTPRERKQLAKLGRWVPQNDRAPKNVTSYTWNAVLPWWASLKMQVREGLDAFRALSFGAWQPLRDHLTETRGQIWSDEYRYRQNNAILEDRTTDYSPTDHEAMSKALGRWGTIQIPLKVGDFNEVKRIMSIDVQGKGGRHYYTVIRAHEMGGRSRLLHNEKIWNADEIRGLQRDWNVNPDDVIFDAAHYSDEIYQLILASGGKWKAFRGDKREHFKVVGSDGKTYEQMWTKTYADPAIGTHMEGRVGKIPLWLFSKPTTIERLQNLISGVMPGWEMHEDADDDYRTQVNSYYLHEFFDTKGNRCLEWRFRGDNHYADCERMQIAAQDITGLIN
jgi:DNA-directed RNA polymerase subunit M/transcription elongation factor TFIIS